MKLNYDRKSKDPTYFIQVGIRNGKKVTTKNVERIGKHSELLTSTSRNIYTSIQINIPLCFHNGYFFMIHSMLVLFY